MLIRITLDNYEWYYDPSEQLGEVGGFGTVYEGVDSTQQTEVAIKRLHLSASDAVHRELQIAEELSNRNLEYVIPVLDSGRDGETGEYFVIMPKAEYSLQHYIDSTGEIDELEATEILLEIASGLKEVSDIVHRDLKPSNVLFLEGSWKIADFGIARFVEASTSLRTLKDTLTPAYAAPEQWKLEHATNATDIYALGCIAYTLLTKNPPFTEPDFRDQHLNRTPEALSANPALRSCISQMLRKSINVRPPIDRVISLLNKSSENIKNSKQHNNNELIEADAHENELILQRDADEARIKNELEERNSIKQEAVDVLKDIVEELVEHIIESASSARSLLPTNQYPRIDIRFGDATLEIMLFDKGHTISREQFSNSQWDVIVGAVIRVHQANPKPYIWSSNLWFTDIENGEGYRWYEVSYYSNRPSNYRYNPHALTNIIDADKAASSGMYIFQLATKPPCPIDGEMITTFCERWAILLARAYKGQLQYPNYLPLNNYCTNEFFTR